MKLAAISDLHYPESGLRLEEIVRAASQAAVDALVLVGDAVNQFHPPVLQEVLTTLRAAAPVCVFVPGNHELWSAEGSTAAIYERHLPLLCEQAGWHYLDAAPVFVGDVAVVGNMGWYDYSLVDRSVFAGAQVVVGQEILKALRKRSRTGMDLGALTDEHLAQKAMVVLPPAEGPYADRGPALVRWNDRRYVRLGVSDGAFTADCTRRLRVHLREAACRADRVVVAVHTVPFAQVLAPPLHPVDSITRAYHGAVSLGEAIQECNKVALVVHGHRHRPGVHQVGDLPVINVTGKPDKGGTLVIRDV